MEKDNTEVGPLKRAKKTDNKNKGSKDARTKAIRALMRGIEDECRTACNEREGSRELNKVDLCSVYHRKRVQYLLFGVLEPMRWQGLPLWRDNEWVLETDDKEMGKGRDKTEDKVEAEETEDIISRCKIETYV